METYKYKQKVAMLGDDDVGKTSLLLKFLGLDSVISQFLPTVLDPIKLIHPVQHEGVSFNVCLEIFDFSASLTEEVFLRILLADADIVILCYSTISFSSIQNLSIVWIPIIKKFAPSIPVLCVGTQADRKYEKTVEYIRKEEVINLMSIHGEFEFFECSVMDELRFSGENEGAVRYIFERAIKRGVINKAVNNTNHDRSIRCVLL